MNLYLPIAEMSVSVAMYLALGAAVGFISGLFGVGGGISFDAALDVSWRSDRRRRRDGKRTCRRVIRLRRGGAI